MQHKLFPLQRYSPGAISNCNTWIATVVHFQCNPAPTTSTQPVTKFISRTQATKSTSWMDTCHGLGISIHQQCPHLAQHSKTDLLASNLLDNAHISIKMTTNEWQQSLTNVSGAPQYLLNKATVPSFLLEHNYPQQALGVHVVQACQTQIVTRVPSVHREGRGFGAVNGNSWVSGPEPHVR